MEYAHLGRTGLRVSRVCLGTMNFGPVTTPEDSFAIMDRAHEHGINFFDTANVYGWGENRGWTERIIGDWFAQGGGRRERTVLATKLYGDMGDWPNEGKLSALNIRRACDASLARLKTDYLDVYQMHHVDRATPWDEIWEAMEVLRQQGKILYVGSSNFAGWHIAQGQEAARRRGVVGLVSEQSIYNLVERTVELEVLPALRAEGLPRLDRRPVLGEGVRGTAAGAASRRTVRLLAQDPAEETAVQRGPGDDAEAVGLRRRQHLELDSALDQVVDRLLAHQAHPAASASRLLTLRDVPAGEVRGSDVEDLALLAQDVHRLPDLVPRRRAVDVVHLVDVDGVGPEPGQARVARATDVERRELALVGPVAHVAVELRGEDRPLAPPAALREPVADDALRAAAVLAPPVDVGRVEVIHALLVGPVHHDERVLR